MNIFSLTYILVLVIGLLSKQFRNGKKIFCISTGTIYFFIAALRSSYVGGDSFNYRNMFELLAGRDLYISLFYSKKDPVFFAFLSFVGKFTSNYTVLFTIVAALFCFAVWYYIYKYSCDPVLSVIVLLAFNLYQFSLTGMRQTIAMSFVIFSMISINEGKRALPYIFVVLGSLFHASALVFMIIPILRHIPITKKKIKWSVAVLIVAFLLRNKIATMLIGFISDRGYQVNMVQSGFTMMLVIFILYIVMAIFVNEYAEYDRNYHFQYWIAMGAVFFETLVTAQNIFFRIAFYFLMIFVTLLPNIIHHARNRNTRLILSLGLYIVLSVQYLVFTIGSCYILPYTFFWQI